MNLQPLPIFKAVEIIETVEPSIEENIALPATREFERLLALVQRLGAIGCWTAGIPAREIHLTPAAQAVLGLSGSGLTECGTLGRPDWLALFAPGHRAALQAALDQADADAPAIDQSLQLESTRHGPRWVRFRGEAVRSGRAQRLEGTLQDVTAQVNAELALSEALITQQALRESQARSIRAMRGTSDGLWDWDIRSSRETLSPRSRELLGVPFEPSGEANDGSDASFAESSGDGFFGRIHADDAGAVRGAIQAHFQHGAPFDIELRLRMQNGAYRWFRSRGQAERGDDGEPFYLSGSITDISSRRRVEDALRDSQAQFSAIFQTAPVGLGLTALDDGIIVRLNDQLARMLGWEADEMVGRDGVSLGVWPDLAARAEVTQRVRQQGHVALQDVVMLHRSGRPLRVNISVEQIELAGRKLLLSAITDVTDRHAAELALREQREAYEAIFNAASDAVVSVDEQGHILIFNPGAERVFQRSAAAVLGQPIELLLPQAKRDAQGVPIASIASVDSPVSGDVGGGVGGVGVGFGGDADASRASNVSPTASRVKGVRADGHPLELEASISQATVGGKRVLTAILHDVTEQVRAEADALRHQLELSALTGKLMDQEKRTTQRLAQALHDQLGQTLTALRIVTDLDRRALPDLPADAVQRRAQVSELVDQAVKQVRRVLVDLRPPMLDEEGLFAAIDNEVTTRAALHPMTDLMLDADPAVQAQRWPADVEYALFMIAREATENALHHASATLVRVALIGSAGSAAVLVTDDGIGMEPGTDRGRPGHLGLIGMRERAHAIGAKLEIDSPPEGGTRIGVTWVAPNEIQSV